MKTSQHRERKDLSKHFGIREFENTHAGSKCFVIGAGPSLKDLDFSTIEKHTIICVNSSIVKMPLWDQSNDINKRFWMSCDILCTEWDYFWKKVIRCECTRIVRNSWTSQQDKYKGIEFRYYKTRRDKSVPFPKEDDALLSTSSIISALNFAILMRCSKIYLVGVDHKMSHGNSHFWQFLPEKDRPVRQNKPSTYRPNLIQQNKVFNFNMKMFDILGMEAKYHGISVYNCSPDSAVKSFEKISFEDALN